MLIFVALNPTPRCTEWEAKMVGEPAAAAKLRDIHDEQCLSPAAEGRFFQELETQISKTPWPADPDPVVQGNQAVTLALLAVYAAAPSLYCQGPKLDHPAGFSNLARVRPAKSYYSYLPPGDKELFLAKIRKTESEVEAATADKLREWIEEHLQTYTGDLNLAHPKGVAWAADSDQLNPPAPSLAEAADVLGLIDLRTQPAGILFRYERVKVPQQHLPRCLDGLGNPPFAMVRSCDAPHGVTQRLSTGAAGLPEAVHGGCNVNRTEFIDLKVLT